LEEELADVQQEIKDKMSSGNPNPDGLYHRRNVLQAKVQHARAQIDLLNQNVEPLVGPGPEENDTSLSWGEWAKSLAPVIKRIKSECKPYLEATEYDVMEYRLYRGLKGTNAPYMSSRVRLTGRKPQATGTHIHDALNEWFTKKFGEPFRNALFTASKADFAADYGNLYLVFPTGNFSFIWSPKVGDLYDYDSQLDEALEEDKEHRYFDVTNGYFGDAMKEFGYRNSGLIPALESGNEIMIRTPVYYGINLSNFWHRNDYDDDSTGEMSDVNQAIKIIQELLTDEDV
jgi:hypothetical protein